MKKYIFYLLTALSVLSVSCKKSNDAYKCATCVSTPEAIAANDASSKGIYKGVLIGSSGTVKFNVLNDGTTINGVMVIDGTTVNLTSSISWVSGSPYVAPFTGTLNGSPVTITFSVDASGGYPNITSSAIPGHPNAQFVVIKELSNALIEAFEGEYQTTRPETGTFNIVLSRPLARWGGIARKTGSSDISDIEGTINGSNQLVDDGRVVGTLSGDDISGEFIDGNNSTVKISGKRTL